MAFVSDPVKTQGNPGAIGSPQGASTAAWQKPHHQAPNSDENLDNRDHYHEHHHGQGQVTTRSKFALLSMMIFPLLGMAAAIAMAWQFGLMSWLNLGMLIGGWYLTGLGITIGFHRLLTHRSFETTNAGRAFWTALGSLSLEGSPLDWCMVHRKHHQFSDHHGDPHSPSLNGQGVWNRVKGFWHSHLGWMFRDNWSRRERNKFIPDLINDPLLVSIDRNYLWWVCATFLIPLVIGGLVTWSWQGAILGFVWGGLARICLSHHMTWSINSICHIFGAQHFKSSDDSRNNLFFGYFSHGEGWHNNHHAFPSSAKHGLKWWQFDLSWVIIRTMQFFGLAWNVKLPSQKQLQARRL